MRRLAILLLLAAPGALADGGVVQLREESGPFAITVFASSPLRAGPVDFSILVQNRESLQAVLGATVTINLSHEASELTVNATHAQAQNKLLYAATVNFPEPGEWKYSVNVQAVATRTTVSGSASVSAGQEGISAHWAAVAFAPLCILIFGFHQFLSRARRPA